jgi:uncharacterized protein (DUF3084 family)
MIPLTVDFAATFIGLVTSIIAATLAFIITSRLLKRSAKKAPSLEETIKSLVENLEAASSSISQIESEISKRREITDKLRQDAEHFQELKALNQAQVDAIAQTIRVEVSSISKKSIWINAIITFVVALIFFIIGFFVGRI